MNLGFARVLTDEQTTPTQLDALRAVECERVFEERVSGGRWDRLELHRMLDQLRQGDVVIVWKLDRLSRSLKEFPPMMERIHSAGARFRSLTEAIETTTPAGRMIMQMVGVFAEFEREVIWEVTRAGLERARKKGCHGPAVLTALSDTPDSVVFYYLVGHAKPEPEMYAQVIAELGIAAERILFVGDTRSADIDGPANAGVRSMLANEFLTNAAFRLTR